MNDMAPMFQSACSGNGPKPKRKSKRSRDCPRVTVRLSPEDHDRLVELADGVALSVFLRTTALQQKLPKRRRSGAAVQDQEAIAKILGMLGESRIANNLNQLAYHANVGSLGFDDDAKAQIDETYGYVLDLRQTLLKALGYKT